jgi:ADP-ribose pyrophosphatase YjhB (NUDIX family)
VGLLLHSDHVLLAEAHDPTKGERFYRLIGGGVDFGERAANAIVRAYLGEFRLHVEVLAPLGVVENLFEHEGQSGHEIVFEYVLRFAPGAGVATLEPVQTVEGETPKMARWVPLAEVLAGLHRLTPHGFEARLAEWVNGL